jgi:DNA processing protein
MSTAQNLITSTTEAIDIASAQYPERLRKIKHAPRILYARGNLSLLETDAAMSVVGTRDATTNGLIITDRITRFLVSKGAVIVSGLALGIDCQAHTSCLEAGGKTIAVLAHGLDSVSPSQNRQLAQNILNSGGLLVSEHPDGVTPQRPYFVQRNRIQVGLSKASVVVEALVKSGTTTHAQFCVQAQHPLFAVLPDTNNSLGLHFQGPKMMVDSMGAIAISTKEDYIKLEKTLLS